MASGTARRIPLADHSFQRQSPLSIRLDSYARTMIALIVIALIVWAVLAVLGFAIKGLLWLAIIGLILFVVTIIIWIVRAVAGGRSTRV